jgi:dihydrofolate reductase
MRIRTHTGLSLDGYMASADGMPVWNAISTFVPGQSHGYAEFLPTIEAVVVGRTTFDFGHKFWTEQSFWPWPNLRVYVLTSRPLPATVHDGVVAAHSGPAALLEQLRNAGLGRDVQLLGGPRVIRAFLELGAIDELGLVVVPVLLGEGVPLFAADAVRRPLRLERQRAFLDGAVELVYLPGDHPEGEKPLRHCE